MCTCSAKLCQWFIWCRGYVVAVEPLRRRLESRADHDRQYTHARAFAFALAVSRQPQLQLLLILFAGGLLLLCWWEFVLLLCSA